MYKETHYCRVTLKLIYLYWKSRRLGFCGRNPNAPLALHFTTLSPKYLKLNKKLPTSRGKKKRNLPSILSKWIVHFLLLTKNYPRILNPISEKHFHVSSIIFHIIFISYLWPQKRIHKPCSLSWKKKKQREKRQRSFLSSSMYKDLVAFIIMAVYIQNSATKTTCAFRWAPLVIATERVVRESNRQPQALQLQTMDSSFSYFLDIQIKTLPSC